jgi:hypothetical protein
MTLFTDTHQPRPYGDAAGINSGVLCTCGEDFKIGRSMPDTPKGKPSRRKLKTMKHCWDAYREHWAAAYLEHESAKFRKTPFVSNGVTYG